MKNDPAFPISNQEQQDAVCRAGASPYGMTLRDYFAAKAMAATMVTIREEPRTPENALAVVIETVATGAYLFADAMLKARAK